MGLFDLVRSLFGGGTALSVKLDADEVAVGGVLSGRATLTGANRRLPVTAVRVRLFCVSLATPQDLPVPRAETRVLLDDTIAACETSGAGEARAYAFSLRIPHGARPSAHNVAYECHVLADIPGNKEAVGKATLRVVPAVTPGTVAAEELHARWPALRGGEEGALIEALGDMRYTHTAGDPTSDLLVAEPALARLMREGASEALRRAALDTWSTVVGERATRKHVLTLREFVQRGELAEPTLREAIEAAAKFARAGGIEVLHQFAGHASPAIRRHVAAAAGLYGGETRQVRQLLEALADDADAGVRAEVFERLGNFGDDPAVLQRIAAQALRDASPEVQRGCIEGLSSAFWREQAEVAVPVFAHLAGSDDRQVRKTLAYRTAANAGQPTLRAVALRLLADADAQVRHEIAFNLVNAQEEARGPFLPRLRELADGDPADEVRQAAIATLGAWLPKHEVVDYYRRLMASSPGEQILRGIVHGARFKTEPEFKAILRELSTSRFAEVAREAREGFDYRD
jgi:HEAT repeat protein